MILRELIYGLREEYQLMSDDSDMTNEFLAYLIRNARGTVLQQRYSDPRNIIPSVELQNLTVPIGVDATSTIQIPNVIKTTGNPHSPLKVYGVGMANTMLKAPLNVISVERLPYAGNNPYTSDQIYCAIDENGTLIFNSKNNAYKLIDQVVARGLFEDPEAVFIATGNTSDFYNAKYPLSEMNWMDVKKLIDAKLINLLRIPKDQTNDATEEGAGQAPQSNK